MSYAICLLNVEIKKIQNESTYQMTEKRNTHTIAEKLKYTSDYRKKWKSTITVKIIIQKQFQNEKQYIIEYNQLTIYYRVQSINNIL